VSVEACVAAAGLRVTLKTTLAQYPGSVHWHVKQGRERGILEMTWWPQERRLWLAVHANRAGEWTEAAAARLKTCLATM
jgi:hypothetical protein